MPLIHISTNVSRKVIIGQPKPPAQRRNQASLRPVIEAPLAFLEVEVEVDAGDAVEAAQVPLGLAPEVLDAVDVAASVDKALLVVDAHMPEAFRVEHVVGGKAIGVDYGIWLYPLLDDGQQRAGRGVRDHHRVDLPAALEQSEHWHLATGSAASFALAVAAEIALVQLDFTADQIRRLGRQMIEDRLAQFVEKQRCGVPVDTNQQRRRTGRRSGYEMAK